MGEVSLGEGSKPPATPQRLGAPAPLPLYLGCAAALYARAISAAMSAEAAPGTGPDHGASPDPLAVAREAVARMAGTLAGIDAWRAAPQVPSRFASAPIWQSGSTALRPARPDALPEAGAHVVLVVPSLINGPQILDLDEEVSLLEPLAQTGCRPILVDWGEPGAQECGFDLSDYVTERLLPAAHWLRAQTGQTPSILGYCMGGTLSLALAEQLGAACGRLCLIGAPWDFKAADGVAARLSQAAVGAPNGQAEAAIDGMAAAFGVVPRDVFQLLFALLDPSQALRKFRTFADEPTESARARRFVKVEDWLNGGPPLAGPAAKQLLLDWYGKNAPAQGKWQVNGAPVSPREVTAKTLIVTGARDHICPPATSLPLADLIPDAQSVQVPFGHVGMIASPRAQASVAGRVAQFFHTSLL